MSPHAFISILALSSLHLSNSLPILIFVLPLVSACAGDPLRSLVSMATADLFQNLVVEIGRHGSTEMKTNVLAWKISVEDTGCGNMIGKVS